MTFEPFLATFDPFLTLFDYFWAFLEPKTGQNGPKWGQNRVKMGQKWVQNGSFWGDFGPFLGQSGVVLGSLRHHFGIVWASFWASFWCRFDPILRPFWAFWENAILGWSSDCQPPTHSDVVPHFCAKCMDLSECCETLVSSIQPMQKAHGPSPVTRFVVHRKRSDCQSRRVSFGKAIAFASVTQRGWAE